jgi:hypothetical protein
MNDASEIPGIAEPWFLALEASIEVTPAMVPSVTNRPDFLSAVLRTNESRI